MKKYILYINDLRNDEFEKLFLNKKYIKEFTTTYSNMNEECIYILTIRDSSEHMSNFYKDLKKAKVSEIISFGMWF